MFMFPLKNLARKGLIKYGEHFNKSKKHIYVNMANACPW